jgi:sacsin
VVLWQGPALCVSLPGLQLSAEELCQLQSPSSPYRLRGATCHYGCGLLSCYLLTDVAMALSGDCVCIWDPAGSHLVSRGDSAVGRQYRHVATDLTSRFADQFRWLADSH